MKYGQILNIQKALEELSKERLTIAYEIAKNIRICKNITDETQSLVAEIQLKYADRDENGNILQEFDEKRRPIFKITNPVKMQQFLGELSKIDNEEHEVTFVKISLNAIKDEKLTAEILLPLLDTVLIEN